MIRRQLARVPRPVRFLLVGLLLDAALVAERLHKRRAGGYVI